MFGQTVARAEGRIVIHSRPGWCCNQNVSRQTTFVSHRRRGGHRGGTNCVFISVWAGELAQQVPDNQGSPRLASFLPGLSRAAPGFIQLVVEENAPDAGHAGQGCSAMFLSSLPVPALSVLCEGLDDRLSDKYKHRSILWGGTSRASNLYSAWYCLL